MATSPSGFCNCPVCMAIIKKILPDMKGLEREVYWEWVMEVKPELPLGFMKGFKHSGAIIQKIHVDENQKGSETSRRHRLCSSTAGDSKCCFIC